MTGSLPRTVVRVLALTLLLSTFSVAQHYTQTNLLSDGATVTPAPTQPPICILRILGDWFAAPPALGGFQITTTAAQFFSPAPER